MERSLVNLGLDRVDLVAIHGINTPELADWSMRPGGCLDVLERLRDTGRIAGIGFSTHATAPLIVRLIESDRFDFVNLHWYFINQNNTPALEAAARHDLGVFIISPSDKGGHLYDPPDKLRRLCAPLHPMSFNDLFCLSRPQVHTLSVGAARPDDLTEHVNAVERMDTAQAMVQEIDARLQQAAREALGDEWLSTWHQGLPAPEETPGGINIPVILWLRNLLLAYDMERYARARYNLLGNGSHWFPGNNAASVDELDLREALVRSPHAGRIPELLRETHRRLVGKPVRRLSQGWLVRR